MFLGSGRNYSSKLFKVGIGRWDRFIELGRYTVENFGGIGLVGDRGRVARTNGGRQHNGETEYRCPLQSLVLSIW